MTIPTVIAANIPKNTPVPMEWRLAEPGPEANTNGNIPNTKASEVIRIGRNRKLAAVRAACKASTPRCTSTWANSTINIAFLAASPIRVTSPIWK